MTLRHPVPWFYDRPLRVPPMTVSTENTTTPESTTSRNTNSSVQIQIKPTSQSGFVPRGTKKIEFVDLVDFGGVAMSVETAISCMFTKVTLTLSWFYTVLFIIVYSSTFYVQSQKFCENNLYLVSSQKSFENAFYLTTSQKSFDPIMIIHSTFYVQSRKTFENAFYLISNIFSIVFDPIMIIHMGWLRLVGSLKWYVSFAEYSLFYRALFKRDV